MFVSRSPRSRSIPLGLAVMCALSLLPLPASAKPSPSKSSAVTPAPAASTAPAPPAWIQRSNANAQVLLEVLARFAPEQAGQFGVPGLDEQVLDLRPGVLN